MVKRRAGVERRYAQSVRDESISVHAAPSTSGPSASLELAELLDLVEPIDRTLLVLVYAAGLTTAEAAEAVGSTAGTVKSRLHRAKARINEILESENEHRRRNQHE